MNETEKKFGAPETVIKTYEHWTLLLRPRQVTLGSLVLICREPAKSFADVSEEAFLALRTAVRDADRVLRVAFEFDKINFLMLMMVDPDVHFHVLPRYAKSRRFGGAEFADASFPGPPDLKTGLDLDASMRDALKKHLQDAW